MSKVIKKANVGKPDPKAIMTPITIWGKTRTTKKPRSICPFCEKKLYSVRVDMNRLRKEEKTKKVGRPRKKSKVTRYTKIGYWCKGCEVFFYSDGTPNYKLHAREAVLLE